MISPRKFILESLRQHWRIHVAVGLAVVAATGVLTGALVVGDSVRGSLRHLALDRLGRIDEVIVADRFFRAGLTDELKAQPEFTNRFADALPAILVQCSVETTAENRPRKRGQVYFTADPSRRSVPVPQNEPVPESSRKARAGKVTVLGIDDMFWSLGRGASVKPLTDKTVILNLPLANELGAGVGDEVILRVGQASQIPADSPLGRKSDSSRNVRLTVAEIIPAEGLGRFGLRPNQQLPLNAFVATGTLQSMLEQPDRVNAIFVAGANRENASDADTLQSLLHPTLGDLGFLLETTPQGYVNVTSTRMLIDPAAERSARKALAGNRTQDAFTYLANYIKAGDGKARIPYSTITAIDLRDRPPLGPFTAEDGEIIGQIADDEIVLNRWAADDLIRQGVALRPGDEIAVEYFEPESTHGEVRERSATFRLKAVAEMTPVVADRHFTPELPGVTDQKSIANWDPPFPYDEARVRSRKPHDEDEVYWHEYKATPKAFIALSKGRRLWGSRFGSTTSIRIVPGQPPRPSPGYPLGAKGEAGFEIDIEKQLLAALQPAELGYQFLPVKQWALAASSGTTPFNALFLGFSFFIVASAVMLVAILFRLGVEQRAAEIGVLAAVGLRWRKIATLLMGETVPVTVLSGLVGMIVGVGYAWLMLVGLKTWWLAAIGSPFLRLHWTWPSLAIGFGSGVVVSLMTIVWTLGRMRRLAVRRLLAGQAGDEVEIGVARNSNRWWVFAGWGCAGAAIAAALIAHRLSREAQAGAFFGSGACALVAALMFVNDRLRNVNSSGLVQGGRLALVRLAVRNASRNPRRSSLTIGLVAAAAFLIVAISAFRLDPSAEGTVKTSGSGGFALVAESSQPIYKDINSAEGRADLGFSRDDDAALEGSTAYALRVQPGDDASCLNLYRTAQPRAIGVPKAVIDRGGFAWAGSTAQQNPWQLLDAHPPLPRCEGDGRGGVASPVPVVLDANTATYSLHRGLGDTFDLTDGQSQPLKVQIVALLKNSIFQGDVLMSEANLLRHFPGVNGYRMFLIETPSEKVDAVQSALEGALGDYGFDSEWSTDRLTSFFAVQNTYLSTFQSLGGLGLLLGTFGLAAVQLRGVLERRGELALYRAMGFRRRRLSRLVMLENGVLLVGGLAVGVATALVAVLPHWIGGDAIVPWESLAVTLLFVLVVGLAAGMFAVRAALSGPVLAALRSD